MELRTKFLSGVTWQENAALMAIASSPQARMRDTSSGLPFRASSGFFSSAKVQSFPGEEGINWLIGYSNLCTWLYSCSLVVTAVSSSSPESFQDSSSLYHLQGRAVYRGSLLSRADARQAWSTNLFVLKGKELYIFDNPLYMQVHSKYDNFINVAEAFVGVLLVCFIRSHSTEVYQLSAESFAEMQNWISNLDRIVQENLGAENRIIQMVDDLIAQREADLCDDLLAELENTEVPQRLILVGTGTPPPSASPLVLSRSGALLEMSRSPDEEHGPSLLHRQALLRSSSSNRSFEALPGRSAPRAKQPLQQSLSRSPHP